jgi:hypothetical protein
LKTNFLEYRSSVFLNRIDTNIESATSAAGCWLLAAGCWAAGCWLLAAGCWVLAAGCWLLAAAGCWLVLLELPIEMVRTSYIPLP